MGCSSSRPEEPASSSKRPLASSKVHPVQDAHTQQQQAHALPSPAADEGKPFEVLSSAVAPPQAALLVGWQHVLEQLRQQGLLGSTPQQPEHGMLLGVSVDILTTLAGIVGDSLTTEEVLSTIVSPAVAKHGCSFASLLSPSASGPPRFFVSHRRGAPFAELADAVAQRVATMQQQQQQPATATGGYHSQPQQGAGNGNRSTSSLPGGQPLVWVDVLCMPQPTASGQQAWTQVREAIHKTEGTLLVLDTHAASLSRLWVVTEVIATVQGDSGTQLLPGQGLYLATPSRPSPPSGNKTSRTGAGHSVAASHCDLDPGVLAAALSPSSCCYYGGGAGAGRGLQCQSSDDARVLLDALSTWDAAPTRVSPSHSSSTTSGPTSPDVSTRLDGNSTPAGAAGTGNSLVEALTGALKTSAIQEAHELLQQWGQQGLAAAALFGAGDNTTERTSRLSGPQVTLNDRGSRQSSAQAHLQSPQQEVTVTAEAAAALRAANALARCGAVLQSVRELELAEGPLRRALQLRGRVLGGCCGLTSSSYISLGSLYLEAGDLDQAEPLLRRGIAHKKRCLGKEHVEVGDAVSLLGLLLLTRRNLGEAEAALRHALRLQTAALGPGHVRAATTAANLASVLKDVGKLGEAEELYRGVLAVHTQALGPSHPHVAVTAGHLAYLLQQQQGRAQEALPFAQQAADVLVAVHGREHPSSAAAMANLGAALQSCGRLREAHTKLQEALDVLLVTQGDGHPDTTTTRTHLAQLERMMCSSKAQEGG